MTDDELDKLTKDIYYEASNDIAGLGQENIVEEAKQAIKAYTDKARIEELEHNLEEIPMRIGELVEYKQDRLKELKGDK
jgi:hypothetical protein